MKTLFLCLMLCALEASAQRIVPVEAKVDSGWVKEMVEFNGKLVMAGRFAGMNGIPARNILAWDGGSGVDDLGIHISGPGVNTLSRFQNGVVFDGGVAPLSHVYFWNGDTTVIIGTAELGIITSTAVFNGVLYAAGGFTTMDGIDARHIAKWDGSAWSPVGAGFNDRVVAMEVYNGSLFIGGYFTSSGDSIQSLLHVARWDGTVMHGVDSGVNGSIRALAAQPGALWLAGDFQLSGDSTVVLPHFAQCTDTVIVPLISDATAQNTSTPGMLVDLGEYGILTRADIWNERVYANGAWRKAFLRSIYCACTFQGTTYVGGVMEGRQAPDYLETDLALCKLLPGTGQVELNVAGISALIRPDGCLFHNRSATRPWFIPTEQGGASAIFGHGSYIVGYSGGVGRTSGFVSYPGGRQQFEGVRGNDVDILFTDRYLRTWALDRGILWAHAAHWGDAGYEVPEVLASWPVNGDIGNGEPDHIAPFQDNDQDGEYEPDQGDLPVMLGDRAVLVLANDQSADALPLIYPSQFDAQILLYGFDSVQPEALHNTLFARYTLTNRSDLIYDSVVVAMVTDADIGCGDDDYTGCDPDLDMFYFYNWDDDDGNCNGFQGFGPHPPALGVVGLNAGMRSFLYYNRDGPPCCNEPNTTVHAVNYADGIWKDGTPQVNTATQEPTRYMYSDYPDVPGGFHETQQTYPDRRGIASFGPFYDVAPGQSVCMDIAFVFARDTTQDNIQNTHVLQQKVIQLKQWYAQQPYGCGQFPHVGSNEARVEKGGIELHPNPASKTVTLSRARSTHASIRLSSADGNRLWTRPWPTASRSYEFQVDMLASGLYYVNVLDEQHASQTLKLIVVH